MKTYPWKYEIEVREESGSWSFVHGADTAKQAYKAAAKYQGKSGQEVRVVRLAEHLDREDFEKQGKGVYVSRDRRYRVTSTGMNHIDGGYRWRIEKMVDGQWQLRGHGRSMEFLICRYALS